MKRAPLLLLLLFGASLSLHAQVPPAPKRVYETQKVGQTPPNIDGYLNDLTWQQVEWSSDFTQRSPYDGADPTQKTAFKVLYDDRNLYLAFRCYDLSPDSIVSRMSRRDGFEGDWVEVNIDSYNDDRTAFSFTSSVSGVKGDELVSNNGGNWDPSWNPIWYLATQVDSLGWTSEVRIPLSQLRYGNEQEQTWGIQVTRLDFRNDSRSVWQHIPQNSGYWVSGFGELKGIKNILPQKQIELQPYVVGNLETFEKDEGNPFATGFDSGLNGGLDGRIGITGDLTLDFTVNPDFGQVEADPSVLTLDGFRIFFQERRPFFIENRNIFDYGVTRAEAGGNFTSDNLFYSRRIGSSPHGSPDLEDDEYISTPENSAILGAAKFSGKTKKGLAIGILESVTARTMAKIDHYGEVRQESVEPLTNYFVGRVQKDYKEGNTIIGGILTATNRDIQNPNLSFMHRDAYTTGVDFTQFWKDRSWQFNARLIGSKVSGSREAIERTQTSFEHFFQRPDASHLEVDTTATSLIGHGGTMTLAKYGGNLVFQGGVTWRSPGLEINDIGFMRNADEINHFFWGGYRINKPFSIFRRFQVNYNHWSSWDFSGKHLYLAYNTNFNTQFKNFWGVGSGIHWDAKDLSNNALFGGPTLRKSAGIGNWWFAYTDGRKKVQFNYNLFNFWAFNKGVRVMEHSLFVRFQPANAFNFSIGPGISNQDRDIQSVGETDFGETTRYIAATVEQRTLFTTIRLNYNITPNLTLQYYGQPFISRARFKDYKYITDPLARELSDQFEVYSDQQLQWNESEELFEVDENLDGQIDYDFSNEDFSFIQFRSNLVARWEYVPGSELFLVWTQGVTNSGDPSEGLVRSLSDNVFTNRAHNIFLIKWTYRFLL
jgi:hypothetical protein